MKVSKDRHQHVLVPSRDDNLASSYQLKACKKMVKVEPMKQMAEYLPGHAIRPIEMFGLCINGLDYRLIDTIDVALEVPLASSKSNCRENFIRGVTMDGHMSMHARLENIVYENGRGVTSGDGTINIGVHPSDKTKKTFPELRKVVFTYDVKLKEGGIARVTPPEYGITRFLRPVINYEGHNERVDNSITKTPLHPTLSGIENEHPIYEYLRANGVHLQIYNSFVEQALRTLFAVVKKYPKVFAIKSPQSHRQRVVSLA